MPVRRRSPRPPPITARRSSRPSTGSSCSAPPPSAAGSSCRSRRSFRTPSSTCGRGTPRRDSQQSAPLDQAAKPEKPAFKPVPPGSYASAVIILLTDGQSNVGPDPIEAARMAAERGVRVYTVGFGTTEGEIIRFEGWSMRVRLDEQTLKKIAELTQGRVLLCGHCSGPEKGLPDPEQPAGV